MSAGENKLNTSSDDSGSSQNYGVVFVSTLNIH